MNAGNLSKEDVLAEFRRIKDALRDQYGVTRIGLFGSLARGDATASSDVDVVVEMTPNLYLRAELKADLESRLGREVDVIRYRTRMNPELKRRIDREALYA